MRRSPALPIALPLAALLLAAAGPAPAASITGVCPDGSIFIVQDRARIPCAAAKEVAPEDVPPMRPEYLPRPYTWQVYREGANPNNPYNLIDAARRVRELRGNMPPPGVAGNGAPVPTTPVEPRPFGAMRAQAQSAPALTLSAEEVRDLFLIVELSQEAAPSRFLKEDVQGDAALEVSFAYSDAFATRLRGASSELHGPVVLFTVLAHADAAFHPNFTFVQGHETFRPRTEDPAQMGILEGRPGPLAAEQVVLGYVALPVRMDLGQPLDLYWNDRRIETRLRP